MLAEHGFDPWTLAKWAQHASAAPLCFVKMLKLRILIE